MEHYSFNGESTSDQKAILAIYTTEQLKNLIESTKDEDIIALARDLIKQEENMIKLMEDSGGD